MVCSENGRLFISNRKQVLIHSKVDESQKTSRKTQIIMEPPSHKGVRGVGPHLHRVLEQAHLIYRGGRGGGTEGLWLERVNRRLLDEGNILHLRIYSRYTGVCSSQNSTNANLRFVPFTACALTAKEKLQTNLFAETIGLSVQIFAIYSKMHGRSDGLMDE